MMAADVAQTELKPFDVIDYENYKDNTPKSYAPPAEGQYTGRVPKILDDGSDVISSTNSFGRTAAGYLKLRIDPVELLDSKPAGYQIRFTELSSKKFSNREGSQCIDLLRACGIAARPKTEAELRAALKMASGRTFKFGLQWEAYNKDTQESTKGMDNFPQNQDGTYQPFLIPDETEPLKKVWANGKIRYFVSAIATK